MKPITAKSDSGVTIGLVEENGYWIRPAKWYDPETWEGAEANRQENEDRRTKDSTKAQRWVNAMARAIP